MLRIFSTHRLFGFLLVGLMITSCGGNTSSNTPSTGTSNNTSGGGGGTSSLADKAEKEWQLYQSDCSLAGPLSPQTFSDGSKGRCVFDANSRPRAFRN
ncbi:hypothetical protein FJR06_07480 [Dolichospermum sp. UHCC 0352]|uniref:hypothetical protein n=1 Tax=Dolichospermum sp. UHCC 0352 TaxID=2590011 RepID=UPI00144523F1|nr:hypothetical protein [Dolichospermum sp. UHCC 0352]MTJ21174.1 hypothetical protein [Dolichospermum sp. UHCC 0352]